MSCDVNLSLDNIVRLGSKTPIFKIENGYLYNSYDNGTTWVILGQVKGADGVDGEKGEKGDTGAKLVSQVLQGQDADGGNIYLQTFDDGTTAYFTAPKGEKGEKGEKGDTGAVKTVAGRIGDIVLSISDINGLEYELNGKLSCNKPASTTGYIDSFLDTDGNSGITFKATDLSTFYLLKYFKSSDELHVQYKSSSDNYSSPLVVSPNGVRIIDIKTSYTCGTNTYYITGGSINMHTNGNVCVLKIYAQISNCTETYQDYTIATLPDGYSSVYECFGTVVAQGDATPAPNQAYTIKVTGNQVQLCTKGVALTGGWVLGGLTFFK